MHNEDVILTSKSQFASSKWNIASATSSIFVIPYRHNKIILISYMNKTKKFIDLPFRVGRGQHKCIKKIPRFSLEYVWIRTFRNAEKIKDQKDLAL